MNAVDPGDEELGKLGGRDGGFGGDEMGLLGEHVGERSNGIKAIGGGEGGDEVKSDMSPRTRGDGVRLEEAGGALR